MSDVSSTISIPVSPDPGQHWQLRYWSVFLSQASSLIGSALTQFVLLWWIADTTGSVAALSLAGLFALLPQALLGPIGGAVADRFSRRFLMIVADLVSAACMLVLIVLFLTERVELWHIYTMMFIRSAMQAFQTPAAAASTAMLVPQSFIGRAAGLNQTLHAMMLLSAAPLGALAISIMPIGFALAIDVATALLGVVPLLIFRIPQQRVPREDRQGFGSELREGFFTVWNNPGFRWLYLLMAFVLMATMPSYTLLPLLIKEHFGGGAPQVALMEGLAGVGMLLGGLLATLFAPKRRILWILWGFSLSGFLMGLVGFAPGNMLWLAIAFWLISSVVYVLGNAPMTALVQTTVPNHFQGRVLSLLTTVTALAAPIGLALATPIGDLIGIRWLFVVTGFSSGAIALLGFLSKSVMTIEDHPLR
ncbi:MFS transporter [Agrobacterium tumefaciens]|uniref:MFS transporter n=1 Tax=Agrobacterium tumefaciens TaxID=358 RepID=UPI001AEDEC04